MSDFFTDELAAEIVASVAHLPEDQRNKALTNICSSIFKCVATDELPKLRNDLLALLLEYDEESVCELIRTVIDVLDGQIALRQMAANEGWR